MVLMNPEHWASSVCHFPGVSQPSSLGPVAICITNPSTLFIIDVPPVLGYNVLVVVIVEKVDSTGGPGVGEQGVSDAWLSKCVCTKNGNCFSSIESKIIPRC